MTSNDFQYFLTQRIKIPNDINEFLNMVLKYCLKLEDQYQFPREQIAAQNIHSLIESLYQIHSLYAYPSFSASTDKTGVNKRAIRDMLQNEIEVENKERKMIKFVYYWQQVANEQFWRFKISDGTSSPDSLLREPAHIFLQMVRGLFLNSEKASNIGQSMLGSLPDGNYLKPVMWAEVAKHKNKPECYGVSLGVRSFVRPLYLCIKLSQLNNVENGNDVKLEDVNSFQSMYRESEEYDPKDNSKYKESTDETELEGEIKQPCISCELFFSNRCGKEGETKINYFGNCAEYDVIRTTAALGKIKDRDDWRNFALACKKHLDDCRNFTKNLEELAPGMPSEHNETILRKYHAETCNVKLKALKYKWNHSKRSYELISKYGLHGRTKNSKKKKK